MARQAEGSNVTVRKARGDKRLGARAALTLEVSVRGLTGTYAAQTVDVSRTGALVWITDEAFLPSSDASNMVMFSERVAQELADGLGLAFGASEIVRLAEVVRVTRKGRAESSPMLVACRFIEPLTDEDSDALGLRAVDAGVEEKTYQAVVETPGEQDGPPPGVSERRAAPRVESMLAVEVQGDYGAYQAFALNLSISGALLTITDPEFGMSDDPERLVVFSKRLGIQFRHGVVIRFAESGLVIESDLVRVNERMAAGELVIVVGVRFTRELTNEEWHGLVDETELPPARLAGLMPVLPPVSASRVHDLMELALERQASDLHIKADSPPRMRVHGRLCDAAPDTLSAAAVQEMAHELMTPEQLSRFESQGDLELAYTYSGVGRFRVSVLRQRDEISLAVRCIPATIPTLESLGISETVRELADRPRGLVLLTGPTRSGKTHTVAAMLDHVNRTRDCHILTLEDPIEFLHADHKAHVTQREVGRDCADFHSGLERSLRQDPDVILAGPMRDRKAIELALWAAETGHLVFATLHTSSAPQSLNRIIEVFPAEQQPQVRLQLAASLQGVVSQVLVQTTRGEQHAAQEILIANDQVRSLIRESKTAQIYNTIQTSGAEGMRTLEAALNEMVEAGLVSYEVAVSQANLPDQILRK